jgi:hypothetical protein
MKKEKKKEYLLTLQHVPSGTCESGADLLFKWFN